MSKPPHRETRARVGRLLRDVADRLPRHAGVSVARRLVAQANAARDAQRYLVAATLYEEALRFSPGNHRIHVQCGHMLKEAGNLAGAERHYKAAEVMEPEDADLALQLGHFYKVAGRPDEATEAYRRALALRPGWTEATEELARVSAGGDGAGGGWSPADGAREAIVPELLPRRIDGEPHIRGEGLHIHRLGATRMMWEGRYQRVLRGVEAIRGWCVSARQLVELALVVDGEIVHREPLQPVATDGPGPAKYVFNLWFDFSNHAPRVAQIELRLSDGLGRGRTHRAVLAIVPPAADDALAHSDAFIPALGEAATVDEAISARPSMIRAARRTPLGHAPRTILVQRVDQLGDLACSVPAIRRLRALFPEARLVGLVTPANADLARMLGMFDDLVVADYSETIAERRRTMSRPAQEALSRALAALDLDVAIDLGEGSASRPLLLLSGARFLYGFKDRDSPWLSAGFELNGHDPVNGLENVGHARKLVALVEGLGAMLRASPEPLPRADAGWPLLAGFGIGEGDRYAVLHSGARLAFSRWPHFATLAERLLEQADLRIVFMADGPDAAPLPGPRLAIVEGPLAFDMFDALLANAAVFVGNDSGPKHLASLRGTPVVSLHMARLNWNEWGQEPSGTIISRRVPCAGCAIHYDPEDCGKAFTCIRDIRPDEVLAAVLAELGHAPA